MSVAAIATTAAVLAWKRQEGLRLLVHQGPFSRIEITAASILLIWILIGGFLVLLHYGRIHAGNAVTAACLLSVAILYLNVLRERTAYGDIDDYFRAAVDISEGAPLHRRYLYPPLWAALLSVLVPFGEKAIFMACWTANVGSLLLVFVLLQRVLRLYGFSDALASLVVAAFMTVNVPMLRTLVYGQINLHVTNAILASILLYRRSDCFSSLALGLAAHLKVSPLVLATGALVERNWRWLGLLVVHLAWIGSLPVVAYGMRPYFDSLANLKNVYAANGIQFRETSIDSFLRAIAFLSTGNKDPDVSVGVYGIKAVLALLVARITLDAIRHRSFYEGAAGKGEGFMNAVVPWSLFMTIAAPLFWEHHGVFLVLPFLLALKGLSSTGEWLWYGAAYALEFLAPTFDFFPWSYGRLLGALILLGLLSRLARRSGQAAPFARANAVLTSVLHTGEAGGLSANDPPAPLADRRY